MVKTMPRWCDYIPLVSIGSGLAKVVDGVGKIAGKSGSHQRMSEDANTSGTAKDTFEKEHSSWKEGAKEAASGAFIAIPIIGNAGAMLYDVVKWAFTGKKKEVPPPSERPQWKGAEKPVLGRDGGLARPEASPANKFEGVGLDAFVPQKPVGPMKSVIDLGWKVKDSVADLYVPFFGEERIFEKQIPYDEFVEFINESKDVNPLEDSEAEVVNKFLAKWEEKNL